MQSIFGTKLFSYSLYCPEKTLYPHQKIIYFKIILYLCACIQKDLYNSFSYGIFKGILHELSLPVLLCYAFLSLTLFIASRSITPFSPFIPPKFQPPFLTFTVKFQKEVHLSFGGMYSRSFFNHIETQYLVCRNQLSSSNVFMSMYISINNQNTFFLLNMFFFLKMYLCNYHQQRYLGEIFQIWMKNVVVQAIYVKGNSLW